MTSNQPQHDHIKVVDLNHCTSTSSYDNNNNNDDKNTHALVNSLDINRDSLNNYLKLKRWATYNHPIKASITTLNPNTMRCHSNSLSHPQLYEPNKMNTLSNFTDFSMENILSQDNINTTNQYNIISLENRNNQQTIYSYPIIVGSNNETQLPLVPKQTPRSRTFYDPNKLSLLEDAFNENPYAPKSTRISLARALNITENQVKVWFQNRRSKRKHMNKAKSGVSTTTSGGSLQLNDSHISSDPK